MSAELTPGLPEILATLFCPQHITEQMPRGPVLAMQSFKSYPLPDGEENQIFLQETLSCTVRSLLYSLSPEELHRAETGHLQQHSLWKLHRQPFRPSKCMTVSIQTVGSVPLHRCSCACRTRLLPTIQVHTDAPVILTPILSEQLNIRNRSICAIWESHDEVFNKNLIV